MCKLSFPINSLLGNTHRPFSCPSFTTRYRVLVSALFRLFKSPVLSASVTRGIGSSMCSTTLCIGRSVSSSSSSSSFPVIASETNALICSSGSPKFDPIKTSSFHPSFEYASYTPMSFAAVRRNLILFFQTTSSGVSRL